MIPFGNDDFMDYMGYRNMILEDKIEECLAAARRGEKSISIDAGDLTDQEADYLQEEVRRRIEGVIIDSLQEVKRLGCIFD